MDFFSETHFQILFASFSDLLPTFSILNRLNFPAEKARATAGTETSGRTESAESGPEKTLETQDSERKTR